MAEAAFAHNMPSRRDEAWRYSDRAWLASLIPGALPERREITVRAGENWQDIIRLDQGGADPLRLALTIEQGARAELYALVSADDFARLDIDVQLAEGAHFELGGVTIGGGDAVREIISRITHAEPSATSNQTVRSVHWGAATGNYLGNVIVARGAQKTDAAQSFAGLLLEKGASANAVPRLEIYADDVKCAHGATVGELDEMAAFYMAARGIPPEIARQMQIRAFIADAFAGLADADAREALLADALRVLGTYRLQEDSQ